MGTVLDFQTPITPLLFSQGGLATITMTYTGTTDISAWGGRMALYVDTSAVLLSLTTTIGGGNGKLVLSSGSPNITATILSTDTLPGQAIAEAASGSWYLLLDPNGTPDDATVKAFGGWYQMNLLGPVA